jgi:hypothetical protein
MISWETALEDVSFCPASLRAFFRGKSAIFSGPFMHRSRASSHLPCQTVSRHMRNCIAPLGFNVTKVDARTQSFLCERANSKNSDLN